MANAQTHVIRLNGIYNGSEPPQSVLVRELPELFGKCNEQRGRFFVLPNGKVGYCDNVGFVWEVK